MSSDIIKHIYKVNAYRDLAQKLGIQSAVAQLQAWQCERLLVTHSDLAKQPKYQLAMGFFVDELYGPKDFSQRDADLVRVIPKLEKVLPQKAMDALNDALLLNSISYDLDMKMTQSLQAQSADGAVVINRKNYALAYREVGEYDKRKLQIDTIDHLGQQLADVIHIRGIGMLIKLARKPAQLAGLLALHEFLERGYNAFHAIGDVASFVHPVLTKEREIMQQLFSASFDPDSENPLPDV